MTIEDSPAAAPDPLLVLSFEPAHAILDRFVFGDLRGEAVDGLQAYFHHHIYGGRRFERLDGGGDRAEVANVLTGTDLAALPLLSIRLTRGDVVIYVLETHARSKSFQRTSYSSVAHTRELIQGPKSR